MVDQQTWQSLSKLVEGLAEADQRQGSDSLFMYDGMRIHPEDVADMLLPSMLCLAQGVSRYVGMGEFGYEFKIEPDTSASAAFPLSATPSGEIAPFHRIAPFVLEVFDSYVLENRMNVARVFEAAAQMIHPEFTLEQNTRMGLDDAAPAVWAGPR